MRLSSYLLVLSLAANLALGIAWWRHPRSISAAEAEVALQPGASSTRAERSAGSEGSSATEETTAAAFTLTVDSIDDLPDIHQALLAAGFPRPLIVKILMQLAGELQTRAFLEFRHDTGTGGNAYWKAPSYVIERGSERSKRLHQMYRDHEKMLAALLGPNYLAEDEESLFNLQQRYGALPPEKLQTLQDLERTFHEKMSDLSRTGLNPESQQQQRSARQAFEEQLRTMLTSQELLEYELRHSETAQRLRNEYAPARLTEDEYRQLFALMRPVEGVLNPIYLEPTASADAAARQQAQDQLKEQIKIAFGPGRGAELMQAMEGSARRENQLVARLNLPLTAAAEVVSIRKETLGRAQEIQRDGNLTPEQRQQQLATLLDDTQQRLTTTLGERGLEAYRSHGGGWLQQLAPRD